MSEAAPEETVKAPSREAQALRRRTLAAEGERDALAGVVEGYRRREVEAVAATVLADPSDLWALGGVELSGLLTEDGSGVDTERVVEASRGVVEQRGQRFAAPVKRAPNVDGGARTPPPAPGPSWSALLGNPSAQR